MKFSIWSGAPRNQGGVAYVHVYDTAGAVVHDGSGTLESYGTRLDDDLTRRTLATGDVVSLTADNILHVSAPITIGSQRVGGVRIGLSLEAIAGDITAVQSTLDGINDRGIANHILTMAVVAVVLSVLGIFLSVLISGQLAHPITALAELARRVGRGEYDAKVPVERSDEIGDLAVAFNRMVDELRHSQAALGEAYGTLERRVEERTVELSLELAARELAEGAMLIARDQAEAADRAKSEFLAAMSHELRTPLNAIIGFSEIMKNETLGPVGNLKYREYTNDIHESGRHLLGLINAILDLCKIESGTEELHEDEIEIPKIIRSVLKLVGHRAEQGGIKLELELAGPLPVLRADERKLKQILVNLLSNAVKFTDAGGEVALWAWCRMGSGHVFQIVDTGIGIAPEDIPQALSRFGQVDDVLSRR